MILKLFNLLKTVPDFFWQLIWCTVRGNDSIIAAVIRRNMLLTCCYIDTNVYVRQSDNFSTGDNCAIYHACYILNSYGNFKMGHNSHLGAFCFVNVCYGNVIIGDNVAVGPGSKLIVYSNHYYESAIITEAKLTQDILIGNNVFIGANCTILPGAVIKDNVIVAAGAVVKGTLESNTIYGGTPAKKIKERWYE